ncbi:hypothetical protein FA15DRAFT_388527 [Coprinopsis marcescibilis]|uniref:G domain-containing protein n=1 Tax=Coprinopsis marcescibilis TaxID=230819 RepID=A0A5C3KWX4_COPMA|nr:hypothetical protein FA15DRAFT_388527 [Coprinopsis marcescibilis]
MAHPKSEIFIIVMGTSAVGKSTFINNVIGKPVAQVSPGVNPCTTDIQAYLVPRDNAIYRNGKLQENCSVYLVDTPGIDVPKTTRRVKDYAKKVHVSGMVYVLSWSDRHKIGGCMDIRSKLTSSKDKPNVAFGFTSTDYCDEHQRRQREQEVRDTCLQIFDSSAGMTTLLPDSQSARSVMDYFASGLAGTNPKTVGHTSFLTTVFGWLGWNS